MNNFDSIIDRHPTESVKWQIFDSAVLPMWIADMDFAAPEPVIRALHERVEHGIFGYTRILPDLRAVLVDRLARLYHWTVDPAALVFLPGVIVGFNLACHTIAQPGASALIQTPVYPPFLEAPACAGLTRLEMELTRQADGSYIIDYDRFENAIAPHTRLFILCNPHNPVGRVFQPAELERLAEICLRHNVIICSDEIHCDLIFSGHQHTPIAALAPEIANHTITLMAPSKTFNVAGLQCAFAIIPDPALRAQYQAAHKGLVHGINLIGQVAALAAYRDGHAWLTELLSYLQANRDYLHDYITTHLAPLHMAQPQGTYLAWIDCRAADLPGNPGEFFLQRALVACNDGATFGAGGAGFIRLNFGCPRSILTTALDRMQTALATLKKE